MKSVSVISVPVTDHAMDGPPDTTFLCRDTMTNTMTIDEYDDERKKSLTVSDFTRRIKGMNLLNIRYIPIKL